MAWEDILEAIALGGSRGIGEYMSMREAERNRLERERQRQEDLAMRQRGMDLQERQLAAQTAREEEQRRRNIESDIAKGDLRETQDVLNLGAIRESMPDESRYGKLDDLFEGRGIGMAAKMAPGQTYAAQRQALAEEEPKGLARTPMSFLDEIPEFERTEVMPELGTRQFDGRALRPTTPAERAAIERERTMSTAEQNADMIMQAIPGVSRDMALLAALDMVDVSELLPEEKEASESPTRIREVQWLVSQGVPFEEAMQRVGLDVDVSGGAGARGATDPLSMFPASVQNRFYQTILEGKDDPNAPLSARVLGEAQKVPYTQEEIQQIFQTFMGAYNALLQIGSQGMGGGDMTDEDLNRELYQSNWRPPMLMPR